MFTWAPPCPGRLLLQPGRGRSVSAHLPPPEGKQGPSPPPAPPPRPRRKFLGLATVGAAAGTQELAFPAVVRAQEPIRIGQLIPFTGFLGAIGEYGKQGATLGVEELNEKGGVLGRKVELITEDEANPRAAVPKGRELLVQCHGVVIEGLVNRKRVV